MKLTASNKKALYVAGGLAVLGYMAMKKAGESINDFGAAVNPVSDQNLVYRGVNSVGAVVSGNEGFSLGSWLYDVLNSPLPGITQSVGYTDYYGVDYQVNQEQYDYLDAQWNDWDD